MDDLEQFKQSLGPTADGYTNGQLKELRRQVTAMAELLLEIYIAKHQVRRRRREPQLSTLTNQKTDRTLNGKATK